MYGQVSDQWCPDTCTNYDFQEKAGQCLNNGLGGGLDMTVGHGLVYQVAQHHAGEDRQDRNAAQCGRVTQFCEALANLCVVLLQNCCVAGPLLIVLDPSTAPDDPFFTPHILVDFPAEMFLFRCVSITFLFVVCHGLDVSIGVAEGVYTEGVLVTVALVAFDSCALVHKAEEQDGSH